MNCISATWLMVGWNCRKLGNLPSVIRGIKSAVTKYAIEHDIPFAWQSRYQDHIIRNQLEMNCIADYIQNNPMKWELIGFIRKDVLINYEQFYYDSIMKKTFSIIRNILAVIGLITTVLMVLLRVARPYFDVDISINESNLFLYKDRIDLLQSSGNYAADTNLFSMQIIQDSARAKEIRDYFQLDTLFPENASTWEKALAIGKFVASSIPHDNQKKWPEHVNAIGLWEYTKDVAPAFNCRLHSIMTFELLLSENIKARYITCMPHDEDDPDCHVVNEVWLPELNKWAMIDTDMGGHYVTDLDGTPLSLKEMRNHYISGEKMMMYPAFGKGSSKVDDYYAYMAKNTYWFSCWGTLSYYQEDYKMEDVIRDSYVNLIPSGFEPFSVGGGNIVTTNADLFWDASLVTEKE